ncbi:MAG: ankyrin repeat domain-containing protein [Bryobacterales bacterium]|nr:ankyrin repeat domain-containing protein [Bryobacterales bacterium]
MTIREIPEPYRANSALALELLRDHPELLHARFSGNVTPLQVAAFAWQRELAESLCAMGAKLDFISAIALGRTGAVRAMLDRSPNLIHKRAPEGGWTALHIAAAYADMGPT